MFTYSFRIREDEIKNKEVKDIIDGILLTGGSWTCAVVLIGFPIKTWSYKNKKKYRHYKIKLERFEESQKKDHKYPVYKHTDEWGQKQLFHDKKSLVHIGDFDGSLYVFEAKDLFVDKETGEGTTVHFFGGAAIAMIICGICAFMTAVSATIFMIQEFL